MARPCTCDSFVGPSLPWGPQPDGSRNCHPCYLYHTDPSWRAVFEGRSTPAPPPPRPAVPAGGPGTELKALISSLGLRGNEGCGCNLHASQMDRWGPGGCRENFPTILGWLKESSKKTGLLEKLKAAGLAAKAGLVLNPLDPLPGLVGEAIRRAEGKTPPPREFEWVSTKRLVADSISLAGLLPRDCSGIVGIPRSGMIPASVVATQLQLPLYELSGDGKVNGLGFGSRGRNLGFKGGRGPLVVVDDTVYSGAAISRARASLRGKRALFSAVYVRPEVKGSVDLFSRELPSPHLLEWNWANNGPLAGKAADPVYGKGVATDLDGVLCHDNLSGGVLGTPFMLPRSLPVPLICTGRRESSRKATEAWLGSWGVRWARLEMLPDSSPGSPEDIAAFKASHYKSSGCGFFIESDPFQAGEIHKLSGLPVVCPALEKVFCPLPPRPPS